MRKTFALIVVSVIALAGCRQELQKVPETSDNPISVFSQDSLTGKCYAQFREVQCSPAVMHEVRRSECIADTKDQPIDSPIWDDCREYL